jgi:hypothetical protein
VEAVIVGLIAYHLLLLRAVSICRKREFSLGESFAVGCVGGFIFVATIHLIGYVATKQTMATNGGLALTLLISFGLPILGGVRCMDARRKQLQ